VKVNTSGLPTGSFAGTDRITFSARNVTLRLLLTMAWQMRLYQISGGPPWVDSERFDIIAKAGHEVESDQMMQMVQTLLEDRFRLVARRETRTMPVYALVAAKNGLKLQSGPCDVAGASCGPVRIFVNGMEGQTSMPLFTWMLSDFLGRQVVDDTKFAGNFAVHLKWTPDGSTPGNRSGDLLPATPGSDPSFFTALEEQLGLRLEPRRGPVETLTVEHAEKPTGN
jgi:uncharacterized protein (TIGR03435 family)